MATRFSRSIMREKIQLSDHFTYKKLFRFSLPTIIMMIFSSIYGVVDGIFVSNFAGQTEFAAINFIMPVFMIVGAVGFMMGAGGTAIVAKTMGEGNGELAKKYFSLFVYFTLVAGAILAALGAIFIRPISAMLGAEGALLDACERYGRIVISAMPAFMLQNLFQNFFIVAEKPKIGLSVMIAAGCMNIVLDAILVTLLPQQLKLEGAAIATSVSQLTGGLIPFFYCARKNTSRLSLTRTHFYGKALLQAITNGSSELMSNVSSSVVTMLFNMQLLKYAGESGVAAYGVIMYVGFIFVSIAIGYAIGTAPIVGFHYGAANKGELKSLFSKSTRIAIVGGGILTASALALSTPLSMLFVGYDAALFEMTKRGFIIFSFTFFFSWFSIFGSSFFTALNNGLISAILAFLRTLVYQVVLILTLPLLLELDGIWFASLLAEALAFISTWIFIIANRKRYGYL